MDFNSLGTLAVSASLKTQRSLATDVTQLSSGLRVNTAADDPSGLAIGESLATKVAGLDQGVQEIQTANNALTVADGAMANISDILQRMRALVVEARSGLESTDDLNNIQAELTQLTDEINTIAQNTQFNGRPLLDGSASSLVPQNARVLIENAALAGGGELIDQSVDPNSPYVPTPGPQVANLVSVDSYDPTTNELSITVTIGSQEASFGPEQTVSGLTVPNGSNTPDFMSPPAPGAPTFLQNSQNGTGPQVLAFNIGALSPGDVGKSALIVSLPAQYKAPGAALQVSSGDAEGSVISVDIPGMSAVNLGVNEVILGDDLENEAAEYRIDYAIQSVAGVRAQVGAQAVSLQAAASAGQTTSVNTQASESAIMDLNVGAAATSFTQDQIQEQLQEKMVQNSDRMAHQVATLVADSIVQ